MSFIYKNADIRDRRVNLFLTKLHHTFTNLMLLDKRASELIDVDAAKTYIANLSYISGDTFPILPLGDELVFQFNSLDWNFESESKFIVETVLGQDRLNILELDYATEGEILPDGTSQLSNGLKIKDGEIIFKNLEMYQYDYKSYELLNEIYRAVEIFFASVESFFQNYYYDEVDEQTVLIYDTDDIDDELNNIIFPIVDTLPDATDRELVKDKYRELRDSIKDFNDDIALQLDSEIDSLLYCINGSKKYSVIQNIETKQLEMLVDGNGNSRRLHKDEEVFFPFHNKPSLNQFIEGLQGKF